MPICNDCKSHSLIYPMEIAGWDEIIQKELPSLYHNTPACPHCGLIGDMKKSKLEDGLSIVKMKRGDPEEILNFMEFYRKRQKDFKDGYSIATTFLSKK